MLNPASRSVNQDVYGVSMTDRVRFGYTLMTEQSGPKDLVEYAVAAERMGFDFEVCSDHYSPWLTSQGHAPYAWTVLGAVAQATTTVELATYVTCPIIRYHPAVVAQKAATLQMLSDGRFILGLGSGENLNEHVTGEGWPPVDQRQDMLDEAITIIRELHDRRADHLGGRLLPGRLGPALGRRPTDAVPIAIAVSGEKSIAAVRPAGRSPDRGRARRRVDHGLGRATSAIRVAHDRSDPDLLGPGSRHRRRAGP